MSKRKSPFIPCNARLSKGKIPSPVPARSWCLTEKQSPVLKNNLSPREKTSPAKQKGITRAGRIAARIIALSFLFVLLMGASGCMRAENNAIESLISPSVIGIDTTENGYRITISALSPSSDLTSNEVINDVYTSEADTLDEAVNALTGSVNRTIFRGHIGYVIFGSDMSAGQIAVCVDYLVRDRDISSSAQAYTSNDGDAYGMLKLLSEGNTRSIHENLKALAEDNPYVGSFRPLTILDLSEFRMTQNEVFYLPCIELTDDNGSPITLKEAGEKSEDGEGIDRKSGPSSQQQEDEGEKGVQSEENAGKPQTEEPVLPDEDQSAPSEKEEDGAKNNRCFLRYTGARLYDGEDKIPLDFRTFRGINLLLSETSICHLSLSLPDNTKVGVNATDLQARKSLDIGDDGVLTVKIQMRFLSTITGVNEDITTTDHDILKMISDAQDEMVKEDLTNALTVLQKHGFDLISIKRTLITRHPFSKDIRDNTDELFENARFKVEVASTIARE